MAEGRKIILWKAGPDKLPQEMTFKVRHAEWKGRNHADCPGERYSNCKSPEAETLVC